MILFGLLQCKAQFFFEIKSISYNPKRPFSLKFLEILLGDKERRILQDWLTADIRIKNKSIWIPK